MNQQLRGTRSMNDLANRFRIGSLLPQVHWKAILQPVLASANNTSDLATWPSNSQAIWVSPAKAHGAWDRVSKKERGCLHKMPLDVGKQGCQTLLLRLPQQTFSVLCVVAVPFFTMGHKSFCMREAFAAQPAHDRRRRHRQHQISGFGRGLFSTV